MNNILTIRERLKLSQAAFGKAIGVTQGNVSHYEHGQEVPPDVARRVIAAAAQHGLQISFDHIYGDCALPDDAHFNTSGEGLCATTGSAF